MKILRQLRYFWVILAVVIITGTPFLNSAWAARYLDQGNGTIADQNSGLFWQQADSYHELKKGINWYQALEYVDLKNAEKFAGFDDWRLPTLKELKSFVRYIPPYQKQGWRKNRTTRTIQKRR